MASPRILVIDDSLTIRKLVKISLEKAGYTIELAETGSEGLARARRSPPSLILLDFTLPDMKGNDVCQLLRKDELNLRTPVALLSAKSQNVRELFGDGAGVVDFINKPFTAPDLVARVHSIFEQLIGTSSTGDKAAAVKAPAPAPAPADSATAASLFTFKDQQEAAKILFSKMRDNLQLLPTVMGEMGSAPPAAFLAQRLLTPDMVRMMLEAMAPIYRSAFEREKQTGKSPANEILLQGHTTLMPLLGLLKVLGAYGRSGELRLRQGDKQTFVYWRKGVMVLATSLDPIQYMQGAALGLANTPPEALAKAEEEQRRTGKPLLVSLAEAGLLAAAELPPLLYEQSKNVLLEALDSGPGQFEWAERNAIPPYAEPHGRPIQISQLVLERLRRTTRWAAVEAQNIAFETVYERAERFSKKLRELELSIEERRLLGAIDGRATVKQIIEKSGQATQDVYPILYRLGEVDLIKQRGGPGARTGHPSPQWLRSIMVADGDEKGFEEPLAHLLSTRSDPVRLARLGDVSEQWFEQILQEKPRMILLNSRFGTSCIRDVVRRIRSTLEISDLQVVGLAEDQDTAVVEELLTAGCDAVFAKPIYYGDLERVLGGM